MLSVPLFTYEYCKSTRFKKPRVSVWSSPWQFSADLQKRRV